MTKAQKKTFCLIFIGGIIFAYVFSVFAKTRYLKTIAQIPTADAVHIECRISLSNRVAHVVAEINTKRELEALARAIPTKGVSVDFVDTALQRLGSKCECGTWATLTFSCQGRAETLHFDMHGVLDDSKTRLTSKFMPHAIPNRIFHACEEAGVRFVIVRQ
jgi:hypothetical protein